MKPSSAPTVSTPHSIRMWRRGSPIPSEIIFLQSVGLRPRYRLAALLCCLPGRPHNMYSDASNNLYHEILKVNGEKRVIHP